MKKLSIILFLSNFLLQISYADDLNKVSLLLLDKSSSSKYEINFSNTYNFRDINFELITCEVLAFDKYIDQIALIKINQPNDTYIGWFFKFTDSLNLFSDKIYEISLLECISEN